MCLTDPFGGSPLLSEAEAHDAWYETAEGKTILATEVGALRPLIEALTQPRVEVGVGTGRFTEAVGARLGLDRSREAAHLARHTGRRGLWRGGAVRRRTIRNGAHRAHALLPCRSGARSSKRAGFWLTEVGLAIGFLPRETSWADLYALRGRQGHPIYRHARLLRRCLGLTQ